MKEKLDRRELLGLLGAASVVGIAAACSSGASSKASGSTPTTNAGGSEAACVLTPEATEGPFYLDINKVRSDVTEGRPGARLALGIKVVDATTCAAITGAAVDIWHTDADGNYSGVNGDSGTFMRGTQLADASGQTNFTTVYPGWYQGRAVHIHIKVHAGGSVVHTGQLFFPDPFTDKVYERSPYSSRGARDTRNDADSIFNDSGGASTTLNPAPSGDRFRASVVVGVKTA